MKNKKYTLSVLILIILHFVGVLGIKSSFKEDILTLSALTLLIVMLLLIINQKDLSLPFWISGAIICTSSFVIEMIGTNTGLIFGEYTYEQNLGFKLWNTPPIIALNWWILIIGSASFFFKSKFPLVLKALLSAFLMVFLDLWMEPLSESLGYWKWTDGVIPIQNYIAWFITAFALQVVYLQSPFNKKNSLAKVSYIVLLLFFIILNFTI